MSDTTSSDATQHTATPAPLPEIKNPYKQSETKPTVVEPVPPADNAWNLNRTLIWLMCLPWYTTYRTVKLFFFPVTFAFQVVFPRFAEDITARKRELQRSTLNSVEPIVGGIRVWLCR